MRGQTQCVHWLGCPWFGGRVPCRYLGKSESWGWQPLCELDAGSGEMSVLGAIPSGLTSMFPFKMFRKDSWMQETESDLR